MSGEIFGHNGQYPSVSKSDQIHVVIFQLFFIDFEVYSIDSSKVIGNFFKVLKLQ